MAGVAPIPRVTCSLRLLPQPGTRVRCMCPAKQAKRASLPVCALAWLAAASLRCRSHAKWPCPTLVSSPTFFFNHSVSQRRLSLPFGPAGSQMRREIRSSSLFTQLFALLYLTLVSVACLHLHEGSMDFRLACALGTLCQLSAKYARRASYPLLLLDQSKLLEVEHGRYSRIGV